MKKALIAVAIAFLVIGAASAQPFAQQNQPWSSQRGMGQMNAQGMGRGNNLSAQSPIILEKITLEGTLELVDSRVAIKKDNKTYFVMIPNRLYGFIDGLKEGASVKIEGYSHEIVGEKDSFAVRVNTLTINGRVIDLSSSAGMMGGRGMMDGQKSQGGGMGYWGR
ncbi:MAG TPA: hypothetical protein VN445_09795 [Rectinemataceae bacterium]|nr:hypothetical protein [Rectinemataceae bacterium]